MEKKHETNAAVESAATADPTSVGDASVEAPSDVYGPFAASADQPEADGATGDELPEPAEVERLTGELAAAREEAQRLEERFLRQAAETENYKKRVARKEQDATRHANESLVRDLLPVIDDLERAVEHGRAGGDGPSLLDGVELVLKACLEALQKHGVTQVTAKGAPFDPERHEAFAHVESAAHEANTVVDEVHRGYYLGDRLLRPSLVSVAKTPPSEAEHTVESDPADD